MDFDVPDERGIRALIKEGDPQRLKDFTETLLNRLREIDLELAIYREQIKSEPPSAEKTQWHLRTKLIRLRHQQAYNRLKEKVKKLNAEANNSLLPKTS